MNGDACPHYHRTIVGGPIGGAIGGLIGQQVDQRLFAPKGRQGPRIGELALQTSTYGQALPKLFGTMRVAGSVIWATDLQERAHRSGGGKGRPEMTSYSYSASFAVALSSRPIHEVRRIWADGKLLRGGAGDWKSDTGFRLHDGSEDQPPDPLIASAEGEDATPAYRGIAYAVFEDLQLADFGNRIPSLTFEVVADEDAITVGGIAEALAAPMLVADPGAELIGYAASGDSVGAAIESLAMLAGLRLCDRADRLALRSGVGTPLAIPAAETGASPGGRAQRREAEQRSAGTLPDEVQLAYYEPARDYQSSVQRSRRGGIGRRIERIDLPAAVSAESAKTLTEAALAERWTERAAMTVRVPWRRLECRPGTFVTLGSDSRKWRVVQVSIERMSVELKLLRAGSDAAASGTGSSGRANLSPDLLHGPTTIRLLDLPPLSEAGATVPHVWIAAAGVSAGWRKAALMMSLDAGASWQPIGATAPAAVIGAATTALPPADHALFDSGNHVDVVLLNGEMLLQSCTDDALVAGGNAAMLGDELIQFGSAVPLGDGAWRLSRLLRGRRGTEHAMQAHAAGEPFVRLDEERLRAVPLPLAAIGQTIRVMATGLGDGGAPVVAEALVPGNALRPPAPVHLRGARQPDGTLRIHWVRRSRTGWTWLSGQDTPLDEETERYRVSFLPSAGVPRQVETTGPGYDYLPAEQEADGVGAAATILVSVEQTGALATSRPSTLLIPNA